MKYTNLIPLAAAAAAVHAAVLTEVLAADQVVIQKKTPPTNEPWWGESGNGYVSAVEKFVDGMVDSAGQTVDGAIQGIEHMGRAIGREFGSLLDGLERGDRARDRDRHGGRHGHARDEDRTIWEMIEDSKYTTRFARLVKEYPDVKDRLKDRKNDHTLFVPTDKAFENMPDHQKPSREFLEEILEYHIVPGRYAAGRVMSSHTLPTALELRDLGHNYQRIRVSVGLLGIHLNFYSKVVATNIEASNGVIHAVDKILVPPPRQGRLIDALPGKFSTFSLAMEKTGLGERLHEQPQRGGTVFAPTNYAFMKLGPKLNTFLFSAEGERYLKALLQYHVVLNETLYSDAFYEEERQHRDRNGRHGGRRDSRNGHRYEDDGDDSADSEDRRRRGRDDGRDDEDSDRNDRDNRRDHDGRRRRNGRNGRDSRDRDGSRGRDRDIWESLSFPGGNYNVDLRTRLGDKHISVGIRRWMGIVSMTCNGWIRVSVQDGISQDGVVHVVESVLMPPRHNHPDDNDPEDNYENDNMSVEDLKHRLQPYIHDRDGRNHDDRRYDL